MWHFGAAPVKSSEYTTRLTRFGEFEKYIFLLANHDSPLLPWQFEAQRGRNSYSEVIKCLCSYSCHILKRSDTLDSFYFHLFKLEIPLPALCPILGRAERDCFPSQFLSLLEQSLWNWVSSRICFLKCGCLVPACHHPYLFFFSTCVFFFFYLIILSAFSLVLLG